MLWIFVANFPEAQDILIRWTDFDKPQFLIGGLHALGDFHASYRTRDEQFRVFRQLRTDLVLPTYLDNYVGPFSYREGLELVRLFETKAKAVGRRPFRVREDLSGHSKGGIRKLLRRDIK